MALNRNVVAEQNASLNELVHTPTFLMVAGALPGLFAATSLEHGAVIGGVCAVAILGAALISRGVSCFTGRFSRVAVALMLNALVMVLVGFGVRVALPVIYQDLGIYLPLTCASGVASIFIAQSGIDALEGADRAGELTFGDAVLAAVTAFLALVFCGFFTGLFTTGQVFGLTVGEVAASPISIFGKPAGSLLLLALVAVFVQAVCDARAKGAAADSKGGEA